MEGTQHGCLLTVLKSACWMRTDWFILEGKVGSGKAGEDSSPRLQITTHEATQSCLDSFWSKSAGRWRCARGIQVPMQVGRKSAPFLGRRA